MLECHWREDKKKGWVKFPTCHSRPVPIPHLWFSSCGKKKFHHSRLRRSWGNFFSPRLLNHGVGNWDRPFVTHGEFFFPHSWLRHSWGKNPIPSSYPPFNRSFLSHPDSNQGWKEMIFLSRVKEISFLSNPAFKDMTISCSWCYQAISAESFH